MLVMELLPGPKLNDGVRSYYSSWDKQNGTTLEKLQADAKRKIKAEQRTRLRTIVEPYLNQIIRTKKNINSPTYIARELVSKTALYCNCRLRKF